MNAKSSRKALNQKKVQDKRCQLQGFESMSDVLVSKNAEWLSELLEIVQLFKLKKSPEKLLKKST